MERTIATPHAGHLPFDGSDPGCVDRVMLAFLDQATVDWI